MAGYSSRFRGEGGSGFAHRGRPVSRAASGRLGESPHEASPVHNARHKRRSCATVPRPGEKAVGEIGTAIRGHARQRAVPLEFRKPPSPRTSTKATQDATAERGRGVDRSTQERQPNNQVLRTR